MFNEKERENGREREKSVRVWSFPIVYVFHIRACFDFICVTLKTFFGVFSLWDIYPKYATKSFVELQ